MIIPFGNSKDDQLSGRQLILTSDELTTHHHQPDVDQDDHSMHFYATHGPIRHTSTSNMTPSRQILSALVDYFVGTRLTHVTLATIHDNVTTSPSPTTTDEPTTSALDIHDETMPYMSAEIWFEKYVWWRIILVGYILLLGLVGNSAVIYSICKTPRFRSKPTNIFILNMAIGDLITSIFCPIVALIKVINEFYVMGWFICRIEGFVKITCLFVSSYSLIVLSFQWLLCVVKPFWKRMSIVHSWITLGIIWALSLGMGIPLIFKRKLYSRKWLNLVERWCQEDTNFITYYWITVCFSLIYVPIICMTVALVIILIKMDKFGYKLRRSTNNQATNSSSMSKTMTSAEDYSHQIEHGRDTSTADTNNNNNNFTISLNHTNTDSTVANQNSSRNVSVDRKSVVYTKNSRSANSTTPTAKQTLNVNMKYRKHIVSILLIYLLVSGICWTPLNLSIIYRLTRIGKTYFPNYFNEFNFFCELGVATSSALNPIIFGFLSRPFRQNLTRSWNQFWTLIFNLFSSNKHRQTHNNHRYPRSQHRNNIQNLHQTAKRPERIQMKVIKNNDNNHNDDHRNRNKPIKTDNRVSLDRVVSQSKQQKQQQHPLLNTHPTSSNTARSTSALIGNLLSNQYKSRPQKRVTFDDTTSHIVTDRIVERPDKTHNNDDQTLVPKNSRSDSPILSRSIGQLDVNMDPGGDLPTSPDKP